MSDGERCENCRFWRPGAYPSECIRYAPTMTRENSNFARWPMTYSYEWCGEWEPRPAKDAA